MGIEAGIICVRRVTDIYTVLSHTYINYTLSIGDLIIIASLLILAMVKANIKKTPNKN
uniref:Uncharacterized protein n=1 Tax=Romanomermis culicivorax TaxID=13658 RepID=A0A915L4B8_ROMCU